MATARILLVLIWFAAHFRHDVPDRRVLIVGNGSGVGLRSCILQIAAAEVGVREASGNNDGPRIEEYLAAVGLKKGAPYCAAYVSWVFKQAGYPAPRTGWCPSLFPALRLVAKAEPEDVFGIYSEAKKRIAHAGLVEAVRGDWVVTLEANTNVGGGREGDGVYRRIRHVRTISKVSRWRL